MPFLEFHLTRTVRASDWLNASKTVAKRSKKFFNPILIKLVVLALSKGGANRVDEYI